MDTNVASVTALKNDGRTKFRAHLRTLGENKAKGEDALPMLGIAVCKATFDGIIVLPKNRKDKDALVKSAVAGKNGEVRMINQVEEAFEIYAAKESSTAVHERKSTPQQVSKLKQFADLGAMTTVVGPQVLERAQSVYTEVLGTQSDENKDKKAKTAYDFYLQVAREQMKEENRDAMLTKEQMEPLLWQGGDAKPKTLEGELQRAADILEMLLTSGIECKATGDKITDDHDLTRDAYDAIMKRINGLKAEAEIAALMERLAELKK